MVPPSESVPVDELVRRTPALRNSQGRQFEAAGRIDQAMAAYRQALDFDPVYPPAAANFARLLVASGRPAEAAAFLEPVAAAAPYDMPLAVNYANALLGVGRALEAEQRLRGVIAGGGAPAQAYNSLGIARYVQRDFPGAVDSFEQAVATAPDFAEAHENLALALLHQRRFGEAWPEYEWRWRNTSNAITKRAFAEPIWDGQPLNGRTLLLHGEQGLGDTIQFVRYAGMIEKTDGRIVLLCHPRLTGCLAGVTGVDRVLAYGESPPAFDCHVPMMSLPRLLATTFDTIPDPSPYIRAEPDPSIPRTDGIVRIGINWVGRPLHVEDPHRNRSCPMRYFADLAAIPNVQLYSLHFGPFECESANIPLVDCAHLHADFADSARLVAAMDLVITVDTALAHLAGAMAKPCWVLLPYAADWRWTPKRDGTQPWYRSIRVFRQEYPGEWPSLAEAVQKALKNR